MSYRGSLMCRLQSEDREHNGMCCHDGVPLWSRLQRADGCTQTSRYVSQPTEKVRQHTDQSGKSNQRYSNLSLLPFPCCVSPKVRWTPTTTTSAAFPVSPLTKMLRFQRRRVSAGIVGGGGWRVKLYLIKGKKLTRVELSVLHVTP